MMSTKEKKFITVRDLINELREENPHALVGVVTDHPPHSGWFNICLDVELGVTSNRDRQIVIIHGRQMPAPGILDVEGSLEVIPGGDEAERDDQR